MGRLLNFLDSAQVRLVLLIHFIDFFLPLCARIFLEQDKLCFRVFCWLNKVETELCNQVVVGCGLLLEHVLVLLPNLLQLVFNGCFELLDLVKSFDQGHHLIFLHFLGQFLLY